MLAQLVQFGDFRPSDSVVLLCRQDHGDVAVLATDENRLALGSIKQCWETLFRFSSRDHFHASTLDKLAKLTTTS